MRRWLQGHEETCCDKAGGRPRLGGRPVTSLQTIPSFCSLDREVFSSWVFSVPSHLCHQEASSHSPSLSGGFDLGSLLFLPRSLLHIRSFNSYFNGFSCISKSAPGPVIRQAGQGQVGLVGVDAIALPHLVATCTAATRPGPPSWAQGPVGPQSLQPHLRAGHCPHPRTALPWKAVPLTLCSDSSPVTPRLSLGRSHDMSPFTFLFPV